MFPFFRLPFLNPLAWINALVGLLLFVAFLIGGSLRIGWNEAGPPAFEAALRFQWPETTPGAAPLAALAEAATVSFGEPYRPNWLDDVASQVKRSLTGAPAKPPTYRVTAESVGRRLGELLVLGPFLQPQPFHRAMQPYRIEPHGLGLPLPREAPPAKP